MLAECLAVLRTASARTPNYDKAGGGEIASLG
jgi:hypothetical protein